MTEEQLAIIKQQVKKELLEEMKNVRISRPKTVWDGLKPIIDDNTTFLKTYEQYQFSQAVSTILRHSFGVRYVKFLPKEREEEAVKFIKSLFALVDEVRVKGDQPNE